MRNLLILFFLSFSFFGFGQFEGGFQWEENVKLTWADFKGNSNSRSHHHALTASGVSIDMKQIPNDSVGITVQANFFPNQSWLKKGKDSDYLLNHEQRHFDIAEIYRRKLIKSILNSDALKSKKINEIIDKLYKKNDADLLKFQAEYDEETHHSQEVDQQEVWDKKIDFELADLEEYNIPSIKFPIELLMTRTSSTSKTTTTTRRKNTKRKRRG